MANAIIGYRCACMAEESLLTVRERTETEDVVAWVNGVCRPAIGVDHARTHPDCRSTVMTYLKIYMDHDQERLGQAPRRS